jgi:hypothetical protein
MPRQRAAGKGPNIKAGERARQRHTLAGVPKHIKKRIRELRDQGYEILADEITNTYTGNE